MRSRKLTSTVLLCVAFQSISFSQEKKVKEPRPVTEITISPPPKPARPPLEFGLNEDTPVKLKLTRTMSSKDAKVNETVDFEVLEDVKVGDVVAIQHGSTAIATVTEARPKRSMGRSGKLNINIDYVRLVDGQKVPLRAVKGGSGGSRTGAMTGAMVATGILFFPAAPLFLFLKGKNITIPQGTEITAYIAADIPLDRAKFAKPATDAATAQTSTDAGTAALTIVALKSAPEGADITIDGKFVGMTPSNVQLKPGEHTITIEKAGFKAWQRTVTVTAGGAITLEATLDKLP